MIKEKIKQLGQNIKQSIIETVKLLWQFKWSILVYLSFYCALIVEYFDPPAKDSPLWGSEAMEGNWNYINQEVYIGSFKNSLVILLLFFLVGTSNMRNHPKLAKLIFLSPFICMLLGGFVAVYEWLLG